MGTVSLEEALLLQASEINALTNMVIGLRKDNKQLKEELNNKNCSDCKNYIKLDNDHVCIGELPY